MKYCPKCGKEIMDEAVVCPGCGCSQENKSPKDQEDSNSIGWGCLGFCIPIVGLILWLVWKKDYPLKSKSAGTGALISVILSLVFYIIYACCLGAAIGGGLLS